MHAQNESKFDVAALIVAFNRSMAPHRETLKRAFVEVKDHVSRAADAIRKDMAAGRPVVPEVDYSEIRSGLVPEGTRQAIRRTGSAVVRGVFLYPLRRGHGQQRSPQRSASDFVHGAMSERLGQTSEVLETSEVWRLAI